MTLAGEVGRPLLVEIARGVIAELRETLLHQTAAPKSPVIVPYANLIEERVSAEIARLLQPSLRPVINATGVILHTNLGRAPLADAAAGHIREVATQYSNLEYDLAAGARGTRDVHTSQWLARYRGQRNLRSSSITDAAAVYLVLAATRPRWRGYRVAGRAYRNWRWLSNSRHYGRKWSGAARGWHNEPDKLADYERAITDRTRLLLRVHRSNFRVVGFTAQPALDQLVALGIQAGVPVYEDLGSGCLLDFAEQGIEEPVVRASFAAGVWWFRLAAINCWRGPQCGVIAGSRELMRVSANIRCFARCV